jgi:RNA polymerase sigma factor (TIGR02999 family)
MALPRDQVTTLLRDWRAGNESALNQLVPLIHRELHKIARGYLAKEWDAHSWQPTILVNEAFLRLVDCQQVDLQGREHFFRLAAKKMREILVDYARKKRLQKKGGGELHLVPIEDATHVQIKAEDPVDLILLNTALEQLEAMDPRKTRIVELRFFAGLNIEEIAELQGLAVSTVHRELKLAKVWLFKTIQEVKNL